MRFYRSLNPIAAITFDLDDTLYDNHPVIYRAETETLAFIQHYHPRLAGLQTDDFRRIRQQLLAEDPECCHDVTEWRRRALERLMLQIGFSAEQATEGSVAAMHHFARWRSRVKIVPETHNLLNKLAKKWPLAVITNGNADPHLFGLGDKFQFILRAGPHGRKKPFIDMYQLACQKLALPAAQILHVGDDLTTDITGAIRQGMQACWVNPQSVNLLHATDSRLLPHLEISRLTLLEKLLYIPETKTY